METSSYFDALFTFLGTVSFFPGPVTIGQNTDTLVINAVYSDTSYVQIFGIGYGRDAIGNTTILGNMKFVDAEGNITQLGYGSELDMVTQIGDHQPETMSSPEGSTKPTFSIPIGKSKSTSKPKVDKNSTKKSKK